MVYFHGMLPLSLPEKGGTETSIGLTKLPHFLYPFPAFVPA
jgi:hypothetical protein